MTNNNKKLIASILQHLSSSLSSLESDSAESLQVSIDCIRDAFNVNEKDNAYQTSLSLQQIFDKYLIDNVDNTSSTTTTNTVENKEKSQEEQLKDAFSEIPTELHQAFTSYISIIQSKGAFNDPSQYSNVLTLSKQKFVESKITEIKAIAENLKLEGNTKLSAQDFNGAIEAYTKAIKYDNTNAIYFANRSSAYSNLKMFENAVEDANEAIKRNPTYGKAYFRLGSANVSLGKYQEAIDAYKTALQYEPTNEVYKSSLQQAETKLASGGAELPDLGDMGGLSGLLSNPMMQNMAKNFMQDPQMMQNMMNNGSFQDLAKNVMQNPDLMNMLGSMMKKQ